MTVDQFVALVAGALVSFGIFRLFFNKPNATIVRVKELRDEALKLGPKVKEDKANSDAAVIDFQRRLREYRAKFGGGSPSGPTS